MTGSRKAEDKFIQRYFGPLANDSAALGLHDDAAQISIPDGMSLVVSTDTIISDIHFFDCDPPASIARKALRVNVSDLVAKGSTPQGYFLSLTLPELLLRSDDWMSSFAAALEQDQQALGLKILGGDTVMTRNVTAITICAYGLVPLGKMVKRSSAETGDSVYVTGTIGSGAVGLWARKAKLLGLSELEPIEKSLISKLSPAERELMELYYLEPPTNLAAANVILRFASASMDVSDGLSTDATTLAAASNVGLDIKLDDVPYHSTLLRHLQCDDLQAQLITGGDDYQVLCTVPASGIEEFEMEMSQAKIKVACIGKVVTKEGVRFLNSDGREMALNASGYDHFS